MDVEHRLARLERDNARLRRLLYFTPFALLLLGYVPANDKIEAAELLVRDKGGAVRARIYVDEQGRTRLMLRDRDSKSTAMITSGEGASISLADKNDKSTVVIGPSTKGKIDVQDPWASPD